LSRWLHLLRHQFQLVEHTIHLLICRSRIWIKILFFLSSARSYHSISLTWVFTKLELDWSADFWNELVGRQIPGPWESRRSITIVLIHIIKVEWAAESVWDFIWDLAWSTFREENRPRKLIVEIVR
jgi:hypothetical protein